MSKADRKYDPTWNVCTAQAGSKAWRKYHLDQLRAAPSWAQGYFCDAVMMSYSQGGEKPGKPPSFASQYTLDEWLALIAGDLDYWRAADRHAAAGDQRVAVADAGESIPACCHDGERLAVARRCPARRGPMGEDDGHVRRSSTATVGSLGLRQAVRHEPDPLGSVAEDGRTVGADRGRGFVPDRVRRVGGQPARVGDERTPAGVLDAEHRQADLTAVADRGQCGRHVPAGV